MGRGGAKGRERASLPPDHWTYHDPDRELWTPSQLAQARQVPSRAAWDLMYGGGRAAKSSFWKIIDGNTHYIFPRKKATSFEEAEGLPGIKLILSSRSLSLAEVPAGRSVYSGEGENVIEHSLSRQETESLCSALQDYFSPGELGRGQFPPRRLYQTDTKTFQETDSLGDAVIYISEDKNSFRVRNSVGEVLAGYLRHGELILWGRDTSLYMGRDEATLFARFLGECVGTS